MLDGRLSLLTPEGVSLALVPAGPARRALAWAIDFVIWLIALFVFAIALRFAIGSGGLNEGIFLVGLFVSYWGYPVLCEVYFGGRTLGKRWLGLEVVRADGLPVGWRESATRNLLLAADFLPLCYAAGLVSMLTDPQFRRLGDLVAGTLVVYSAKPRPRQAALDAAPMPLPFPLDPEQQRALIDLIERAERLPLSRRLELADLAEPLTGLRGEASLERLRAYAAGLTR
ncbi:RDD family protein [Chitinimonas koreensis]|uniref:RDD family protein n=1 Tax=Chitinimonas koreensis TaxID=356302 RepID=UPI000408766F|nr:RDD family protein [Chitinimonas koreensis]QNM95776.1 RDD family protein [Chitinimonas koreensis]